MKTPIKKLTLLFVSLVFLYACGTNDEPQEPTVDPNAIIEFTDPNFKAALLEHGKSIRDFGADVIDTNNDNEIQIKEALAYNGAILCAGLSIASVSGIEYFLNLKKLLITENQNLTTMDVSKNTGLDYLNCRDNSLTKLDVSKNTTLEFLAFSNNKLTQIDVSKNTMLEFLDSSNNKLTQIDVSKNTKLIRFYCTSNYLTSLNVANTNNRNLSMFAQYNTNLTCIQIDSGFTPSLPNWKKDDTASYSDNCQ